MSERGFGGRGDLDYIVLMNTIVTDDLITGLAIAMAYHNHQIRDIRYRDYVARGTKKKRS